MQSLALHVSANQGWRASTNEAQLLAIAHEAGRRGLQVTCGGDNSRMVGLVCRAARAAGGRAVGVITEKTLREQGEPPHLACDRLLVTATRAERRQRLERCDGIALAPGGYDTVAEFFHWLAAAQLGLHSKSIVLFDRQRRWDGLLRWIDHAASEEFVSGLERELFSSVHSPRAALDALARDVANRSRPSQDFQADAINSAEAEGARRSEREHARRERIISDHRGEELGSVTVYMGARFGRGGAQGGYAELARELGRGIAQSGLEMVFGGGVPGNMGETSRACVFAGGTVTGITTERLRSSEPPVTGLTRVVVARSMAERKGIMEDLGGTAIAEPGGFGTAEEVFQVLSKGKRVWLIDPFGYYDKLSGWLDHMARQGYLTSTDRLRLGRCDSVDSVLGCAARGYRVDRLIQRLADRLAPPGCETAPGTMPVRPSRRPSRSGIT